MQLNIQNIGNLPFFGTITGQGIASMDPSDNQFYQFFKTLGKNGNMENAALISNGEELGNICLAGLDPENLAEGHPLNILSSLMDKYCNGDSPTPENTTDSQSQDNLQTIMSRLFKNLKRIDANPNGQNSGLDTVEYSGRSAEVDSAADETFDQETLLIGLLHQINNAMAQMQDETTAPNLADLSKEQLNSEITIDPPNSVPGSETEAGAKGPHQIHHDMAKVHDETAATALSGLSQDDLGEGITIDPPNSATNTDIEISSKSPNHLNDTMADLFYEAAESNPTVLSQSTSNEGIIIAPPKSETGSETKISAKEPKESIKKTKRAPETEDANIPASMDSPEVLSKTDLNNIVTLFVKYLKYHKDSTNDESAEDNMAPGVSDASADVNLSEMLSFLEDVSGNDTLLERLKNYINTNSITEVKNPGQLVSALAKDIHNFIIKDKGVIAQADVDSLKPETMAGINEKIENTVIHFASSEEPAETWNGENTGTLNSSQKDIHPAKQTRNNEMATAPQEENKNEISLKDNPYGPFYGSQISNENKAADENSGDETAVHPASDLTADDLIPEDENPKTDLSIRNETAAGNGMSYTPVDDSSDSDLTETLLQPAMDGNRTTLWQGKENDGQANTPIDTVSGRVSASTQDKDGAGPNTTGHVFRPMMDEPGKPGQQTENAEKVNVPVDEAVSKAKHRDEANTPAEAAASKVTQDNVQSSQSTGSNLDMMKKESGPQEDPMIQNQAYSTETDDKSFYQAMGLTKNSQETEDSGFDPKKAKLVDKLSEKLTHLNASNVSYKEEHAANLTARNQTETANPDAVKNETMMDPTVKSNASPAPKSESAPQGIFPGSDEKKAETEKSVVGQIVKRAALELGKNKSELKIDIKPDTLGAIRIQVRNENHQVIAKITAENVHVKEAIEHNLEQLKTDLSKGGLQIDSVDVSVDQENHSGRSGSQEEFARQVRNMARFRQNELSQTQPSQKIKGNGYFRKDTAIDYYA